MVDAVKQDELGVYWAVMSDASGRRLFAFLLLIPALLRWLQSSYLTG
jgi:hypothetical protein